MTRKHSFLLASSALGYGLAFILSSWFWWLMFFFLVPLWYLGTTKRLSFKEGIFYGILLWGSAASGVFYAMYQLATGPLALKIIPIIGILLAQSLFVGLWFWLTSKIITSLKLTSKLSTLTVWIITTALYFYWVVHYSLSFSQHWEGYFLMHPLLPLTEHSKLLSFVPPLSKEVVTLLLFGTNAAITFSLQKRTWWPAALSFVPWLLSYTTAPVAPPPPAWLSKVAVLAQQYRTDILLSPLAKLMGNDMKTLIEHHPETELIVLPEYALRINLASLSELATFWDARHVGKPVQVIMGAHNWEGDSLHNAFYLIYDGKIQQLFNKRHIMPLIEGVSNWYNIKAFTSLYHAELPPVSVSTNDRKPFTLFDGTSFVPYICSELFFNDKPDDSFPQATIIALCKDTWTTMPYIHRLMFLAARFKALEWQRPILYVAYRYNGYIDTTSTVTSLAS